MYNILCLNILYFYTINKFNNQNKNQYEKIPTLFNDDGVVIKYHSINNYGYRKKSN